MQREKDHLGEELEHKTGRAGDQCKEVVRPREFGFRR